MKFAKVLYIRWFDLGSWIAADMSLKFQRLSLKENFDIIVVLEGLVA